jgi:acyl-ACP thioesterase
MPVRKETFRVHTFEADAFGSLAVPALSGFLGEAAGLHASELGVGLEALRARGLSWVLLRLRVELGAPIALGERLEVETWPSGVDRVTALREFLVRRQDGTEVARATTQWLLFDLATRKPVRPADVLDARVPRERTPPVVAMSPGKLPELRAWEIQKRFHVRYADIDANQHVTNTTYLAWAIEAVPRDVWLSSRPASVEVQYLAETQYGAAVLSRLAPADGAEGATRRFAHAIVREEDGKELARAVTAWVPRAARDTMRSP